MNFRSIKKDARKSLKHHLFISILVCFVVTIIVSSGYKFNTSGHVSSNDPVTNSITRVFIDTNNFNTIEKFVKRTSVYTKISSVTNYKSTRGVLSVFFNQITGTGSIVIGILNANNQFFFHNSLPSIIIFSTGILIYIMIFIFIQNIIIVGKNRYFLEHRKYQNTAFDKILFVYKVKKTKNVAKIMLIRNLKMILWWFTVIMAPIKHYEYSMVPYILAENPEISMKDCFELSKQMTAGYKFTIFKMDLSLIPWYILGLLTLGITNIFYFNPYKESIYANVYMILREKLLPNKKDYFKDEYLQGDNILEEYPMDKYFIEEVKHKKWLKTDYKMDYSLQNLVLFFFTFSILGYLWEVLYTLFNEGLLVNRGTMVGPWVPIYGWGSILIIVLLINLRDKPVYMFLGSFVVSGLLEYSTAWYLETFNGMKWWDYSGYFLNIDGRICLEGLLVFALAGCTATYFIIPYLDSLYKKIKPRIKTIIIIILVALYCVDFVYSTIYPNNGAGITIQMEEEKK